MSQPINGERNPNNPVTIAARTEWHKLCAIMMHKAGLKEFEITESDITAFTNSGHANIVFDTRGNRLMLRIVSNEEGERLARESGGLPV